MATGYSRVSSANIIGGNNVRAVYFNAEYDALAAAFHASTGHNHDGTAGGGAKIVPLAISGVTTGQTGLTAVTSDSNTTVRTLTAPAAGFTITNPAGVAGNPTFVLANDLAGVEGLASTGLTARTAADTWTTRTLTGTADRIGVSNGDGVSGNPTVDLATVATVTPGAYTAANVTVDAYGRVTLAASGTAGISMGKAIAAAIVFG